MTQRHLLHSLIQREFSTRFQGAIAPIWWLAQPLLTLAVFAAVFGTMLKIALPAAYGTSYVAFLASAIWPWAALQETVIRATAVLVAQAGVLKRTPLPRWMPVFAIAVVSFAIQSVVLVAAMGLLAIWVPNIQLAALFPAILPVFALFLAALGFAFFAAATYVFVRDLEQMLPPLLMVLMFLAPIQYPLEAVPVVWRSWLQINPLTYPIDRLHGLLLKGDPWFRVEDIGMLAVAAACALVGFAYFQRLAPHVDDLI